MGIHVYVATDASGQAFNYRGEVGVGDDPISFQRMMAKRGIEVLLRDQGEDPPVTSPTGRVSVDHWRNIPRRKFFPVTMQEEG